MSADNVTALSVLGLGRTGSFWADSVREDWYHRMCAVVRGSTAAQGLLELPRSAAHAVGFDNPSAGWRVFQFRSSDVRIGGMALEQYNLWRESGDTRTIADALVTPYGSTYPLPEESVPVVNLNETSPWQTEMGIPLWFIRWPTGYVPRTIEIKGETLFQGFDFRLHGEWLAFFQDPALLFPTRHVVCSSGADLSPNSLCHVLGIDRRPGSVAEIARYHWNTFSASQFFKAAAQASGYDISAKGRVSVVAELTRAQACLIGDNAVLSRAYATVGESCGEGSVPGRALRLVPDEFLHEFVSFPAEQTYSMFDVGVVSDNRYFPIGLFLGGKYKDTYLYTQGMNATVVEVNDVNQARIELHVWDGSAFVVSSVLSDDYVQETGVLMAAQNTSLWEVLTGDSLGANIPADVVGPADLLSLFAKAGLFRRLLWFHMADVVYPDEPAKLRLARFVEHQRPTGTICIISNSIP